MSNIGPFTLFAIMESSVGCDNAIIQDVKNENTSTVFETKDEFLLRCVHVDIFIHFSFVYFNNNNNNLYYCAYKKISYSNRKEKKTKKLLKMQHVVCV